MEELTVFLTVATVCIFGIVALWLIISNRRQMQEFEQRQLNYRAEIKSGSPSVGASIGDTEGLGGLSSLLPLLSDPTVQTLIKQFLEQRKGE